MMVNGQRESVVTLSEPDKRHEDAHPPEIVMSVMG